MTGFGHSRILGDNESADSAPEVLSGAKHGYKRDVWALGIMYFQLITGKNLIESEGREVESSEDDVTFAKEILLSVEGLDFLNSLLCFDENKRLNWPEAAEHHYFKSKS